MTTVSVSVPESISGITKTRWYNNRILRRFLHHRTARFGLIVIGILTLACIIGPRLLPYDQLFIDLRARFAPPMTGLHFFGTDPLGRDIAARLLMAGRISLMVGFASMALSMIIGVLVGLAAGYFGGRIGAILMRTVDAFLSFPSIFLLLALANFVKPDPVMIVVIIAATSWMDVARLVEAETKSLKEREFILAARMLGLRHNTIMFSEILPNIVGPIIVSATLTVARAILIESYLSFLGYGIQPPTPSWGNMLNGAQQYLTNAPWLAIIPGLTITAAVIGFNFIGDGLRDALDTRSE
jgi:peptide/nickel transport system permease protein